MVRRGRTRLLLGMVSVMAATATGALLVRSRSRRFALADRVGEITQRAMQRLGVPAESSSVSVGDVVLHTVLAGPREGPLAVLLHGFPECWYSWRHQIPVLAGAGYRVAVPDQRGYNLSSKPSGVHNYQSACLTADILGLIQALGRDQAVIVAHDWGGLAAWRFAMEHPEAIDRLVIMNAPHPVALARELRSDWSQRLKSWYAVFFQLPWLPEFLLTLAPITAARQLLRRTAVRPGAFSEADLAVFAAAMAQPDAMASMINWYRAAFRGPDRRRASPITVPTLLIWAEDDFALGMSLTHGLERWLPNLQIQYIANCGHWVQNEAPLEVNERMMRFLQGGDDR